MRAGSKTITEREAMKNWQEAQAKDVAELAELHIGLIKDLNEAIIYSRGDEERVRKLNKYMVPLIEQSLGVPVTVEQLMPWREGSK